jgi:type IX secretion system PorP/SprF family membrane protein
MNKYFYTTGRLFLSLLVFMAPVNLFAQQTFSYTQYMNNQTPLNPAYSLLSKTGSLNTLIRKQWTGIEGAPSTFLFNMNLPVDALNAEGGLYILNDQIAVEHLTEINGFFAKSVPLDDNLYLGVSLNAGIRKYAANYSSLDPYDPEFRDDVRETRPNMGFGLILYSDHFFIGASVPEMTTMSLATASVQNNTFFKHYYHFSGAYLFESTPDFKIKPAFFVTYATGVPIQANLSGTLIIKSILGLGLNYRTDKEAAGLLTVHASNLRVGYSYQFDAGAKQFSGYKNATQEISISYFFGRSQREDHLL